VVSLAVKLPYRASSELVRELGAVKISHEGKGRVITRKAAEHKTEPPAKEEVFNCRKVPSLYFATTSPVEREMRELNRRADVGARWSQKGIENLLKILFLKRLNQY